MYQALRSCRRPATLSLLACFALGACGDTTPDAAASAPTSRAVTPHVAADSPEEAGRYLVIVAGCNDCHTDGYLATDGDVPEADWLTGSPLGWRGPWGTTYAANLRLRASEMSEDDWVAQLHNRRALPPMPWVNVRQLSDQDARAMYRYIRSLGAAGEHMPAAVAPGKEPTGPYMLLEPTLPTG